MTAARKERHHGHASPRGLNLHGEVWASRLWLVWVVFPEGFPLAGLAEVQGAEVADGI
jgi:hypothetical protein